MPKLSPKEKCFKEAVEKYEELTGKKTGIEIDRAWTFNGDTLEWETIRDSWWRAVGSLRSEDSPTQVLRRPDITINRERVLDLKFTRKNNVVDKWNKIKDKIYGRTQRQDYVAINEQSGYGSENDPQHGPSLNPDRCGCGPNNQGETVPAQQVSPAIVPYPMLRPAWQMRLNPSFGPGVRMPGVRVPFILKFP